MDAKAHSANRVLDCLQRARTPLSGLKISVRLDMTEIETLEAIRYLSSNGLIVHRADVDSSAADIDEILRFWESVEQVVDTER